MKNTFTGLHAGHYDLIYADKPYAEEARFVAAALGRHGVPPGARLLDLACGSGRHARELAALGYEVTGVDLSEDLLGLARERAPELTFVTQDMTELDLGSGRFGAVTCLFDSIGYPQSNEAVIAALAGARRHLEPSGVLGVEFLHTPAMLAGASPVRVRRIETGDGGLLMRISETELDRVRGVMHVSYELLELRADGSWERWTERQSNRFFAVDEMRALMVAAGLEPLELVAAYEDDPTVRADTFHVMGYARPAR